MRDDDIKALEAHKAELSREVEDAERRRDDVRRQIAEARGQPVPMPSAKRTSFKILAVIVVLTGIVVAIGLYRSHTKQERTWSCAEVRPMHEAAEARTTLAFTQALSRRGLQPIVAGRVEQSKVPSPAWTPFDFPPDPSIPRDYGIEPEHRVAIAGARLDDMLVRDGKGGVFRVTRAPRERTVGKYRVKACYWGCFGAPPEGAYYPREVPFWILPRGETFRGEIVIDYDAPMLELEIEDLGCSTPS